MFQILHPLLGLMLPLSNDFDWEHRARWRLAVRSCHWPASNAVTFNADNTGDYSHLLSQVIVNGTGGNDNFTVLSGTATLQNMASRRMSPPVTR